MLYPRHIRFIAHFENGEKVIGNPIHSQETGWKQLPDQPILALEYVLPHGDSLILCDYQEYLHMIEAVMQMGSNPMVAYVYLMGKKNKLVTSYRLTLSQAKIDDRYKVGDITVREFEDGKEYNGGPTSGWRRGK